MSAATTTPHTPWPTVKLGDVCELKNGYTPKAEELNEQGVIPYFRISAMNFEGNEKRMIKPTAWLASKKRCFNAGSIVFPKNGGAVYTRKVRVLEYDSVVDLNTGVCTPDKKTIDCEYLYHWFSNLNITDVVVEGTIPFVDFGMLREVSIPLPSLDIQREIVAKVEAGLKEADALAAHFKRLAALADDTFKAELDETFSTLNAPTVKLGDVCERLSSGKNITAKHLTMSGTIPVFGANGLRGFTKSSNFNGECVIIGRQGAQCGNVRYFQGEAYMTDHAVVAQFKNYVNTTFMMYTLKSLNLGSLSKQAAQPGLSVCTLSIQEFPLPSLDIQREIVAKLEAVKARCERLKSEAERGLKAAEALRKAVLAEAFEQ